MKPRDRIWLCCKQCSCEIIILASTDDLKQATPPLDLYGVTQIRCLVCKSPMTRYLGSMKSLLAEERS